MAVSFEKNQQRRLDRLRRQRRRLSDLVNDCWFDGGPTRLEVARIEEECRKFAEALARSLIMDDEPPRRTLRSKVKEEAT
jgi:hypothetical protein